MRIHGLMALTLTAVLTAASVAATPGAPAGPAGRGRGRGAAGQAPAGLGAAMTDMNTQLTAIKAEAADPAKADQAIHDISVMARDVAIAKLQTPPYVNKLTDADQKAKEMATFRTMLNGVTRTLLDLEDAVNAKKPDDVKAAIAKLEDMEKAGHAEFHVGQD